MEKAIFEFTFRNYHVSDVLHFSREKCEELLKTDTQNVFKYTIDNQQELDDFLNWYVRSDKIYKHFLI